MSEFERQLATALKSLVPEPPREISPSAVKGVATTRHGGPEPRLPYRTRVAVAGAVLLAVLLAGGAVLLTHAERHLGSPTNPAASVVPPPGAITNPAELAASKWRVWKVHESGRGAGPGTAARLVFQFKDRAADDNVDDAAGADITPGRIRIDTWVNGLVAGHGVPPAHTAYLYTLLHGRLTWWISGNTLTMAGLHGSIEFHRTRTGSTHPTKSRTPDPPAATPTATINARTPSAPSAPDTRNAQHAKGCYRETQPVFTMILEPDGAVALCVILHPDQRLAIANDMMRVVHGRARVAHIRAGGLPRVTIAVGHAALFHKRIGDYFARGQHAVHYGANFSPFVVWVR